MFPQNSFIHYRKVAMFTINIELEFYDDLCLIRKPAQNVAILPLSNWGQIFVTF